MRFRRAIFAGLAPLLTLSAVVAATQNLRNEPSFQNFQTRKSLAGLLLTVVHLVSPEAKTNPVSASSSRPSPQAFLAFSALAFTPLRHSLWMVASHAAVFFPPPLQTQLRC